jgi:DeoR/GlpR family transcriptional regulator of sugar metabolism
LKTFKSSQQYTRARHVNIVNLLKANPTMLIADMSGQLGVSQSTIRRDLEQLEDQGLVRRIFGAAVLENRDWNEPPFETRETLHPFEKEMVGMAAAELVEDQDVIFIDGGTTTEFMVPHLANKKGLTVITCGINIALRLNRLPGITTLMIGGQLQYDSHSMTGPLAVAILDIYSIRCKKAFISGGGVSAKFGLTNRLLDRIPLKRKAMDISEQSIVVVDGSKIGAVTLSKVAPLTAFHGLVTDSSADPDELDKIRAMGLSVSVAQKNPEIA